MKINKLISKGIVLIILVFFQLAIVYSATEIKYTDTWDLGYGSSIRQSEMDIELCS